MPKLRRQTFETAIIERYRRRESSVEEALIEMYLAGISVRRVEDITEALCGNRVSLSTVSNKKIYTKIEACRVEQVIPPDTEFPDIHWRKIRTNNPLERIMKEIRRRTRVVGAFPDDQSCLNPAAADYAHRRNDMVGQMLHEYAATLSAAPI